MSLSSSEYTPYQIPGTSITPFKNQVECFTHSLREFRSVPSTLSVMATGSGKTIAAGMVAKHVIEDEIGRVLVLANRDELLVQWANALSELGLDPFLEKAESYARAIAWEDPRCVIASVSTMKGKRLKSWPRGHFDLVIVDEAHHRPAPTYCEALDWLAPKWELGMTATADRLDDEPLVGDGCPYRTVAYEYSLDDAIYDGIAIKPVFLQSEIEVDLSEVKMSGHDLNAADLEAALLPYIGPIARSVNKHLKDRRCLHFTPRVFSADALASALRDSASIGIPCESVCGAQGDRLEVINGFRAGKYRHVANAALFTEGTDFPFVSGLGMFRPTESRALFSQMVGRVTRTSPATNKADAIVIDCNWTRMSGRHRLVHPVEIFDRNDIDSEVIEIAKGLVDGKSEKDLFAAVQKAKSIKKARDREKLRITLKDAECRMKFKTYDPLATAEMLGVPIRTESVQMSTRKATPKQIAKLEKNGIQGAAEMSIRRASSLIDVIVKRQQSDLCTIKQVALLIKRGVDPEVARAMRFDEARARLDVLLGQRRGA